MTFFRRRHLKDSTIGGVLLYLGFITQEQLLDATEVKVNANGEALIGEILVAHGAVTRGQLTRALVLQRDLRGSDVDYVAEARNLIAAVHARTEVVQAKLDDLRITAEEAVLRITAKRSTADGAVLRIGAKRH
jgi:hypothetical protein